MEENNKLTCRFCDERLEILFADLGASPLANSFLTPAQLLQAEVFYPLRVYVCGHCLLVQAEVFEAPEAIFTDYAYFASYSNSWLEHAKQFAEMAVSRFRLGAQSLVLELASNDGYLLQYFVTRGVPVLGVEPAANVADVAIKKGIPTVIKFFGEQTSRELVRQGIRADLIVGNNVLAHVPQLNDFVQGMKLALKADGVITMEFPHLMRLVEENQFDTIYHEHFSYFSLLAVERIFAAHGLTVFDVDALATHGGSLRIYAKHSEDVSKPISPQIVDLRRREEDAGFACLETYRGFTDKVKAAKYGLLEFLIKTKREKKSIVGYGAPAKGNTLLNYCGIRSDFIDYTVDRSPHKQGRFLPGTHIPIYAPEKIQETKPDYLLILPWNLREEIIGQMAYIRRWGGRFVVPIPELQIYS